VKLEVARRLVVARSYGKCEGCGRFGFQLDVHHRQARGMGGVSGQDAEDANDVRNLLALCRSCHDETENAATWRRCELLGWRLPAWVDNVHEVPARIHTVNGYAWWRLTNDAGYQWIDWELSHENCLAAPSR
jgi:hypothetical protein